MPTPSAKSNVAARPVTVVVPNKGVDNLAAVQKVVANTLNRLGCGGCLSGLDIRFRHLGDLTVNPKTLELEERFG